MNRLVVSVARVIRFQDFVLRVLHLQTVRRQLELSVQNHALLPVEHVGEERLIEPDRAQRAGRVAKQDFEDFEAWAPRRTNARADDFADHRRGRPRTQRGDGAEAAAILVADREAVQQILDRHEPDALQIGRAARTDTFQILKRALKRSQSRSTPNLQHPTTKAKHHRPGRIGNWELVVGR